MAAVILMEPEGEINIGSVCRAMMNMNAGPLILINPQVDSLSDLSLRFALHASKLLKDAIILPTLEKALHNYDFSVAVTRRTGQWRKKDFEPHALGGYISRHPDTNTCLVFGRESSGLTSEEVNLCDAICSIPSHSSYPSLNLSHAVMVVLYEIYQSAYSEEDQIASPREIKEMIENIELAFRESGMFHKHPAENLMLYFKKVLTRQQPEHFETVVLSNAFKRLRGYILRLKKNHKNN